MVSAGDHPFHNFLFKKGGTYNEHIINAAKDLGKELFLDMPLASRKQKINEQVTKALIKSIRLGLKYVSLIFKIDKLQLEIDSATKIRLDMFNEGRLATGERHLDLQRSITNMDDKIQVRYKQVFKSWTFV